MAKFFKLITTALFLIPVLSLSGSIAYGAEAVSSKNTIACNGCDEANRKYRAYIKAKSIGFPDPLRENHRPVKVYVLDFPNGTTYSYSVWDF